MNIKGNEALIEFLEARIRKRGSIPFNDYMETVLYHPKLGYYETNADKIGARGDFYTIADVDSAIGSLLTKLFCFMADQLGEFRLVEIGAGKGLLAKHILECHAFPYLIVERSEAMRRCQEETLSGFDVEWSDRLPERVTGCIFSNEFFDALPVRRFVKRSGSVKEIFVGEGFSEIEATPELDVEIPLASEGQMSDLSFEAGEWISRIGASLDRGYHLVIDYGYLEQEFFSRPKGTLMCYRSHQTNEDPYSWVGEQDMTAHVNFSDLIENGQKIGLEFAGYTKQREFLIELGLLELMRPLAERQDATSIQRVQALKTLLLPQIMGDRFKVLLQRKKTSKNPVPGFRND